MSLIPGGQINKPSGNREIVLSSIPSSNSANIYAVLEHSIFLMMRNADVNFARNIAAIFVRDIVRR